MADPVSSFINAVTDQDATTFIQIFTDWQTTPVLATSDIALCVQYSRRQDRNINPPDPFTVWLPNTAYATGAQVVAQPRNGNYFTAAVGGTTGATQPTWPGTGTVTDGTVTWTNSGGAPWLWTWKLAHGVKLGWEIKLGRLATVYDFKAGDQTLSRHQMFENVKDMISWWARKAPEQVKLMGSLRDRALYQNMTNQNDELFIDSWWRFRPLPSQGGRPHWVN